VRLEVVVFGLRDICTCLGLCGGAWLVWLVGVRCYGATSLCRFEAREGSHVDVLPAWCLLFVFGVVIWDLDTCVDLVDSSSLKLRWLYL